MPLLTSASRLKTLLGIPIFHVAGCVLLLSTSCAPADQLRTPEFSAEAALCAAVHGLGRALQRG
eukprot:5715492-Lingulodinium_polyedra.AAC.1